MLARTAIWTAAIAAALCACACTGPNPPPAASSPAASVSVSESTLAASSTPAASKTPIDPMSVLATPVLDAPEVTRSRDVQIVELAAQLTMTISVTVKPDEIGKALADILPTVFNHVYASNGATVGMPFARYRMNADGTLTVEAGAVVVDHVAETDRIKKSTLPAGTAAKLAHVGPYAKLPETHVRMDAWLAENKREAAGDRWEVYVTDPGEEPDESKLVTDILVPLK